MAAVDQGTGCWLLTWTVVNITLALVTVCHRTTTTTGRHRWSQAQAGESGDWSPLRWPLPGQGWQGACYHANNNNEEQAPILRPLSL